MEPCQGEEVPFWGLRENPFSYPKELMGDLGDQELGFQSVVSAINNVVTERTVIPRKTSLTMDMSIPFDKA